MAVRADANSAAGGMVPVPLHLVVPMIPTFLARLASRQSPGMRQNMCYYLDLRA